MTLKQSTQISQSDMELLTINENAGISDNKTSALVNQFRNLIDELRKKQLNDGVIAAANEKIKALNTAATDGSDWKKSIRATQTKIVSLVEKQHKIVPRNYYRNFWLPVGMSVFGIPIGVAFGLGIGNMGLLGVGLPIGMGIGVFAGMQMDKKAAAEGRQLDIELKA